MKRFFYSLLALLVLMPCEATDHVRTSSGISFQTGQGVMQRMRVVSLSKKHRLNIGAREGAYPGMPINQPFRIVLDQNGVTKQKSLVYQGKSVTVF